MTPEARGATKRELIDAVEAAKARLDERLQGRRFARAGSRGPTTGKAIDGPGVPECWRQWATYDLWRQLMDHFCSLCNARHADSFIRMTPGCEHAEAQDVGYWRAWLRDLLTCRGQFEAKRTSPPDRAMRDEVALMLLESNGELDHGTMLRVLRGVRYWVGGKWWARHSTDDATGQRKGILWSGKAMDRSAKDPPTHEELWGRNRGPPGFWP